MEKVGSEAKPRNGETKDWRRHPWIAHCGTWWAWTTWHVIDPEHRPARPRVIEIIVDDVKRQETRYLCGECGEELPFKKHLPFHDDLRGSFLRFYLANCERLADQKSMVVQPGQRFELGARAYDPFLGTHLSIESRALGCFEVVGLTSGRCPAIDDPLSADHFVVRISEDEAQPIDRGGAIYGSGFGPTGEAGLAVYPYLPVILALENTTKGLQQIPRCALFGLPQEIIARARRCSP